MAKILLLLLFCCLNGFSQKSEILVNKNLKHNYPVGTVYILEQETDISRLLFAGEISLITGKKALTIKSALQRIEYRCKEINANSYKLKSFQVVDTTLSMIFDAYFINEPQVKTLKTQRVKNNLYIFHSSFDSIIRKISINDFEVNLYQDSVFNLALLNNRKIVLKTSKLSEQLIEKNFKTDNDAYFMCLGAKKNYISGGIPYAIWYLNNKYNLHSFETFYNLDYNTGRLLIDIYKTTKQISIP